MMLIEFNLLVLNMLNRVNEFMQDPTVQTSKTAYNSSKTLVLEAS